jgi:hypothetical protein
MQQNHQDSIHHKGGNLMNLFLLQVFSSLFPHKAVFSLLCPAGFG